MTYQRMTSADRYRIEADLKSGLSLRSIAKRLKRSASSISREIKRNRGPAYYCSETAIKKSKCRRAKAHRSYKIKGQLKRLMLNKLKANWSPEQICAWLKKKKIELSRQTIYRYIERERRAGNRLVQHLRLLRRERHDRKRATWIPPSERLTKRTWIDRRPKVVDKRSRLGDFERDTVFGKINGPLLLTIVDRKSRYAKLEWIPRKCSRLIHKATVRALKRETVRTITNDNGIEFVKHEQTAKALGTKIYFSRTYRAWERGTNENFNGLLRQYFPRYKCIGQPTRAKLKWVERQLNTRPRKILGWKTPAEVHKRNRSKVLR